jgi:hypothetical protein
MSIDYEAESESRESAAEMPKHYFLGEQLKPFSFGRNTACQRMLSGGAVSPLESATMVVFVCTLDRDSLEATRTREGRDAFRKKMEEWADAHRINLRSHAGSEVMRIADEIWEELDSSEFDVRLTADQKEKGHPHPNGLAPEKQSDTPPQ